MSRLLWRKIGITAGAALIGAGINLFPVSLFFGANFVLGGVVAQVPTILFGPAWGAVAMGLATLPTVAYWRDPFFPFLMALSAFATGLWLRRHRSRVVEGALLVGFLLIAPIAFPVYLRLWDLPTSGVVVITAKVIVNFMADVVVCSFLLGLTGLEPRLSDQAPAPWDMRAHLASGLSLVVFVALGAASVFFGNAEYRKVQTQAAADVRFFTAGVQNDLSGWISDRQWSLTALAAALPTGADPSRRQPWLTFFRAIHPEVVRMEVAVNGQPTLPAAADPTVNSGLFPPEAEVRFPTLRLTLPLRGAADSPQGSLAAMVDLRAWERTTTDGEQGQFLVLDQAGHVVIGPPRWPPGTPWRITDLGLPHPEFQDVTPVLPDTNDNTLVQWQDGQVVYAAGAATTAAGDAPTAAGAATTAAGDAPPGWTVVGLLPLAPYQDRLFFAYQIILLAGLGLLIPFTLAIRWVSRRLTRPLEHVAATAEARLLGDRRAEWPVPGRIAEVNVLVSHLRAVEDALTRAQGQLASRNQALEEANRNLERVAAIDPLTHLSNRRTLDTILDQELKRARRSQHSGALIMIDVDDFKVINDTHGHPVGDAALTTVARTIESCVRESDLVARYGGDELAVVLFDMGQTDALEAAERIRTNVQSTPITVPGGTVYLTVSQGIAIYPANGETLSALISAADRALYTSKTAGRNRISVHAPGPDGLSDSP